jgi:hypothetical protein
MQTRYVQEIRRVLLPLEEEVVENTKTTERGGESVVYKLKQFYAF